MRTVTITNEPLSISEFEKLRDELSTTPEGGATIFLLALKIFSKDKILGNQCLVLAADRNSLTEGNVYKGFNLMRNDLSRIESQLNQNNKIPDSYIKGGSPENNYSIQLPYIYEYSTNPSSGNEGDGLIKLFVTCYGADTPRPIHLKKNNRGIWKVNNWSSVIVGIKKPPIDDDL